MVHTTRVLGPCRAMDTARGHGCQKWHPCLRAVDMGTVYRALLILQVQCCRVGHEWTVVYTTLHISIHKAHIQDHPDAEFPGTVVQLHPELSPNVVTRPTFWKAFFSGSFGHSSCIAVRRRNHRMALREVNEKWSNGQAPAPYLCCPEIWAQTVRRTRLN